MKILYIFFLSVIFIGCINPQEGKSEDLFDQYSYLLKRSYQFSNKNPQFLNEVNAYAKNCQDYNFNDGRCNYLICNPILFNQQQTKAIVMVLRRGEEGGQYVDRMIFISANYEGGWAFKIKKGATLSYQYGKEDIIPSDQELSLRALRDFIDEGYMKKNSVIINDDFFKGFWYAFQ